MKVQQSTLSLDKGIEDAHGPFRSQSKCFGYTAVIRALFLFGKRHRKA